MCEDTRQLDEALAENTRLRALLDELEEVFHRAPVGLFAMDGSLRFIHINERLAQINRRTVSEHVGRRLGELIPPEVAETLEPALRRVLETGEPILDAEVSGSSPEDSPGDRHFLASCYPIRSGHGKPTAIVGSVVEITERKRAEAALHESETRLREANEHLSSIVNTTLIGIAITRRSDGRILQATPGILSILDFHAEEAIGRTTVELGLYSAEERRRMLDDLAAQGSFRNREMRFRRSDGRVCDWLCSMDPLTIDGEECILTAMVDITERRAAEEALRVSEARYRMLFDSAPISIWELDLSQSRQVVNELLASGIKDIATYLYDHPDEMARVAALVRLVDVNQETVSVLGVASKEDVPRDVTVYFPGEMRRHLCALMAAIARGSERVASEIPVVTPPGAVKTLVAHLVVPPGYEESHARVLLSFLDISERKRAEEERRAMEVRVVEAQKLESLGILAGGVAHHFNNLLTAIVGGTSLALMHVPPDSRAAHFLHQVEEGASRATELTNQMLAYSGAGRLALEPVDLSRVVVEMRHLLETGLPGKVHLRLECEPDLPAIEADPAQIRQVVMNLVLNGGEAIGESQGSVTVATRTETLAPGMARDAAGQSIPGGDCITLSVSDTGPGMSEETRARIFEPFFTTKFTGRGLGMAAVLGIARGHGGWIRVESALGEGTTVRVHFPRVACAPDMPAAEAKPRDRQGRGMVLVVDDEEVVRNVAGALLEALGFNVLHAGDGIECIEVYEANRDTIVAVLLDVAMPRMDGAEALQELRRIDPDVRVLVTSGYPEGEAARRFAGLKTANFIEKPYRLSHLQAKMQALLGDAA